MLVGGSTKAWIVVPTASFEDNFRSGGFFDQSAGVFKNVAYHIFSSVGALAEWVGSDRTRPIKPILRPVRRLVLPLVTPGKIASICSSGGFFPL